MREHVPNICTSYNYIVVVIPYLYTNQYNQKSAGRIENKLFIDILMNQLYCIMISYDYVQILLGHSSHY